MSDVSTQQGYPCPVCRERPIETVVTAPSVRGFLLAYQFRTRKVVACRGCARGALLGEAGKSLLLGWFSPTSLVVNPFLIVWNVARAPFVSANPEKVERTYRELGVPVPGERVDVASILYALATNMIAADGKFEDSEVETAEAIGRQILSDFNPETFREVLGRWASLPAPEQNARLMGNVLDPGGKRLVSRYLYQIACADGRIDGKEKRLLARVGSALFGGELNFQQLEAMALEDGAPPLVKS